ncbi:MAG: hypothetical protein ABIZ80_08765, partial [Bryobacteraceae bacterium]
MRTPRFALILLAAVAVTAAALYLQRSRAFSQPASISVDDSTISFRVRFGVNDTAGRPWDGTLTATNGEVLRIRDWHPMPGDKIDGNRGWTLSSQPGTNFVRRPWEEEVPSGVVPYILAPGIIVDLKGSATTSVQFQTRQGTFVLTPRILETGKPMPVLGGSVMIDRVPTAVALSGAGYQDDFPTMLSGTNGEVWTAWIGYSGKSGADQGSEVFVRRFNGSAWEPAQKLTPGRSDVFLVKMARDGKGRPWTVWAEQVNGNFDLYGRFLDGATWSAPERLTTDPQPDVYHQLATDSKGNLWL